MEIRAVTTGHSGFNFYFQWIPRALAEARTAVSNSDQIDICSGSWIIQSMKRAREEDLEAWAGLEDRKPLIVRGARQVGKSFLVRSWGERRFQAVMCTPSAAV